MEKEKMGSATMYVDEDGALRADCDDLALAISVKPPSASRFEFSEPYQSGVPPWLLGLRPMRLRMTCSPSGVSQLHLSVAGIVCTRKFHRLTGVDLNAHSVAKLKHGSTSLFSSTR